MPEAGEFRLSCETCTQTHRRCSGELNGCERCLRLGKTCIYTRLKPRDQYSRPERGPSGQPFDVAANRPTAVSDLPIEELIPFLYREGDWTDLRTTIRAETSLRDFVLALDGVLDDAACVNAYVAVNRLGRSGSVAFPSILDPSSLDSVLLIVPIGLARAIDEFSAENRDRWQPSIRLFSPDTLDALRFETDDIPPAYPPGLVAAYFVRWYASVPISVIFSPLAVLDALKQHTYDSALVYTWIALLASPRVKSRAVELKAYAQQLRLDTDRLMAVAAAAILDRSAVAKSTSSQLSTIQALIFHATLSALTHGPKRAYALYLAGYQLSWALYEREEVIGETPSTESQLLLNCLWTLILFLSYTLLPDQRTCLCVDLVRRLSLPTYDPTVGTSMQGAFYAARFARFREAARVVKICAEVCRTGGKLFSPTVLPDVPLAAVVRHVLHAQPRRRPSPWNLIVGRYLGDVALSTASGPCTQVFTATCAALALRRLSETLETVHIVELTIELVDLLLRVAEASGEARALLEANTQTAMHLMRLQERDTLSPVHRARVARTFLRLCAAVEQ